MGGKAWDKLHRDARLSRFLLILLQNLVGLLYSCSQELVPSVSLTVTPVTWFTEGPDLTGEKPKFCARVYVPGMVGTASLC